MRPLLEDYIAQHIAGCDAASTARWIAEHAGADASSLALKTIPSGVAREFALTQVSSRAAASHKLPAWHAVPDIVYAPRVSMEQCSSLATAAYKARLAGTGDTLVDLTGGLGVDFSVMSRGFKKAVYVEPSPLLCGIARHNFAVLGLENADVANDTAEAFLAKLPTASVIYLDPSRRDGDGRKVFRLDDCSPSVVHLNEQLLDKGSTVIAKLSPMLDIRECVRMLHGVREVHLVCHGGECKELLLVLRVGEPEQDGVRVVCADIHGGKPFSFILDAEPASMPEWDGTELTGLMVHEPNAAVMKSGGFASLSVQYGVRPLAVSSHLFVSRGLVPCFPGRSFVVDRMCGMGKRELRKSLDGVGRANVAVRNFPLSATELARKLKLRDGGQIYIFGTTLATKRHVLLICRKC